MLTSKKTNWIPSLFNEFLGSEWVSKMSRNASPAVNIIENDNEYRVEMAAPGMTKDDLKINVREDNCLVIYMSKKEQTEQKEQPKVMTTENSGEDNSENGQEKKKCSNGSCSKDAYDKYLRKEFSVSYFNQILEIPENVEKDVIDAKFENGVLVITLPKKESVKTQNAKEIEIK
ncbi:MAG: Hsp20/alpha crystallin family protein [Rikenellaceae bacterium]